MCLCSTLRSTFEVTFIKTEFSVMHSFHVMHLRLSTEINSFKGHGHIPVLVKKNSGCNVYINMARALFTPNK